MALKNEYCGRSVQGLPTTDQIIALCREKGLQRKSFTYSLNGSPIAFIKYGCNVPIGEVRTHLYVYKEFRKMMNNAPDSEVKVPEIYHAFEHEDWRYIVMEYVDGVTAGTALRDLSADKKNWIYDQLAKAINQLLRVPVPSGQRPGPFGGGRIQHHFFRYDEAPVVYNSVGMLQRHINEVYHRTDSYSFLLSPNINVLTSLINRCSRRQNIKSTSLASRCASVTQISQRITFSSPRRVKYTSSTSNMQLSCQQVS
jgi:hypothetical protein